MAGDNKVREKPGVWCLLPLWKELWGLSLRQGGEHRSHRKHKRTSPNGRGTRQKETGTDPRSGLSGLRTGHDLGSHGVASCQPGWTVFPVTGMIPSSPWARGRDAPRHSTLAEPSGHVHGPVLPGHGSQALQLLC